MSRDLNGWTSNDLLFFLKSHNFKIIERFRGSHDHWYNEHTKKIANVHVLHNNSAYAQLTLRGIIQQMGYDDGYGCEWRRMSKRDQKAIAKNIKKEQC